MRLTRTAALAFLASLALAGTASADVATPTLTGSDPVSPGASTTPRIYGHAGGVGTSVLGPRTAAVTRAFDPESIVTLYTDAQCAGPVAATGTAEEFEGDGIQVTVAPESTTVFYATLTEVIPPGATSGCSSPGLAYRHVVDAPVRPEVTGVTPESPANGNLPSVTGSADPEATVSIYADAECSGAALASGSGAKFSGEGIEVPVADNSTTTFYAEASWAGLDSGCSTSSVTYQEVTPAQEPEPQPEPTPQPEGGGGGGGDGGGVQAPPPSKTPDPPGKPSPPRLRTTPEGTANDNTPLVTGKAPGAATVKIYGAEGCKGTPLTEGSASQFAAGLPVEVIDNTVVTFYGVSVDGGGDRSACTDEPVVYTEDSTIPHTRITAGPALRTHKKAVVFRFADITGGSGDSFLCRLDRGPWGTCTAPLHLSGLGFRKHVIRVKAFDAAGNSEQSPAKRSFRVLR